MSADRHAANGRPTPGDGSVPTAGRYVPEVLIPALDELAEAWVTLREDPGFREELGALSRDFVGRPTPMTTGERGCRTSSATTSG